MTKQAALKMADELGLTVENVDDFMDTCAEHGLVVGIDNQNGDWVVLDAEQKVLARAA